MILGHGKEKWKAMKEKKKKEMEEQAIEEESLIDFDAEVKRSNIICLMERSYLILCMDESCRND